MLLHPDTARVSVQRLHPTAHKEYFSNRQINSLDQLSINSNYQGQESNDTDDTSVGDINEITFSILLDDRNNEDYVGEDDDDDDDDENYDDDDDDDDDDDEDEQEESDEEKRVSLKTNQKNRIRLEMHRFSRIGYSVNSVCAT